MKILEFLWKENKVQFDELEKAFIGCYITFLREAAKIYLEQGRKVFSKRTA